MCVIIIQSKNLLSFRVLNMYNIGVWGWLQLPYQTFRILETQLCVYKTGCAGFEKMANAPR